MTVKVAIKKIIKELDNNFGILYLKLIDFSTTTCLKINFHSL